MISKTQKQLAQWAMQYGLKQGCKAVRVTLYTDSEADLEIRDGKLDKLQQSAEIQLVIHVFLDGKYGSFSTNRLEKRELATFIDHALEAVRYLSPDPDRKLPASSLYYKGGGDNLDLVDAQFGKVSTEDKIKWARAACQEIMGEDPRILSVQAGWNDGLSCRYLADSQGFEGESAMTYYSLAVSVSIQGEGDAKPESFWYDQALTLEELQQEGIGKKALERALRKIGQKKVASGKYPMLVDKLNSGQLFAPILSALSGYAIQQNNSFLIHKKGEKIFPDWLRVIDDPLKPHAFGSRLFDNEGVALYQLPIIDQGVLMNYYLDTYQASKLQMPQTTGSPSRIVFNQGTRSLEEMMADLDRGILVTGFNGGNSNSSSGDFSFGMEGFLIENGRITQPVAEMNITGNLMQVWNQLREVGNDPWKSATHQIPSLLFEDVDFSGI